MKEEKDIDSFIRGKLENFSTSPPPHIWINVLGQLAAQKRKKRMAYLGWVSAAAVIVMAFLAGWYFNDSLKIENSVSVRNETTPPVKSKTENSIQSSKLSEQNTNSSEAETKNSNKTKYTKTAQKAGNSTLASRETLTTKGKDYDFYSRENNNLANLKSVPARVAQKQQPQAELAYKSKTVLGNTLSEQDRLLIAENIKNTKTASKPDNKWKMGMYVAPGYSSFTASHTESYTKNMTYSGSNGNTNVSGGFSVQYKTSKKWIVESGVYYAQNGQQSENSVNFLAQNRKTDNTFAPADVKYFTNAVRVENNNLAMNSTAGVIQFSSTPKGAELSGDFEASKAGVANLMVPNGEFSQVFEFMEIPIYVRYRLVDSKIGVELITGLNAGVVIGNNAYIDNQYGLQNIGKTQDISTVNVSGTLGMGVNYALSKHFAVALEPRLNYYLNSINTNSSVDFRPYRIGFYTGVSYEF